MRGLQHHILVLLWCLVGWGDDQCWMCSPPIKELIPGSGVISCSGPACAKTRPVRALYNPDEQAHVCRPVRAVGGVYADFVVWKLLCRDPLMASRCLCL